MKNKRSGKKKTNCQFCLSQVTNFERHLVRHHTDSKQNQDFLCHPKKSPERKNIIKLIRNKGNFNEYLFHAHLSKKRAKPSVLSLRIL